MSTTRNPHSQSLRWYYNQFAQLDAPTVASLRGDYLAAFAGPAWLRLTTPVSLALLGLRGWCGKRLDGSGSAVNLVRRGGMIVESLPIRAELQPSRRDGKPALAILYLADSPRPWNKVRDELRILDDSWLLGLTGADLPGLRGLPFPFLLARP